MNTSACFPNVDDEELEITGKAIRALSSPARLRILCLLFEGEKSVVELTRLIDGHTQSSISQHLGFLLKSDIVSNRKYKTQMRYRINDRRVLGLMRLIGDIFCTRNGPVHSIANQHEPILPRNRVQI
jgi:DNA-binding transcriptional ArsR family regulator